MSYTRRSVLASLGAGAALTAGCLGAPGSGGETQSVSLMLNWTPNGLHVPYYAAQEQGFYEEEGVEVTDIVGGDGSDASARQAGLGNNEFAVTSSDQVLLTTGGGVDVESVGVMMQKSANVVFSTREAFGGELTDPQQLAGKTVGTGPGMVRMLTELYLEAVGVREDVELVDTGYETVQRLLAGEVDAAGGVFGDAIDARYQGATVDSLSVAEKVPSYGHVLATAPSFAEENPETVSAFLRGTARGAAWATNNPEQGVDALVAANESISEVREQARETWETLATEHIVGPVVEEHGWGWNQSEPWTTVADALESADSGEVAPTDEVWTNDYLDTDDEYVGSYTDRIS
ncbi:ABC transporter substrate-binding protein [Halolamina salifodinae]|uniref:Thiamine pyrimidine synthase n=1 Tax=Halolamina salifodinae TaxID=1202767 RepID=A0A8T4GVM0_9EURY|nr:ABC transporter substrate-binding protein [Halolamina salifodinae]MBP1986480.1 NitT/TauT family transport system substrate-binding protein [Halolamina salifodinae]